MTLNATKASSLFGGDVPITHDWFDTNQTVYTSTSDTGGTSRVAFSPVPSYGPRFVYTNFALTTTAGDQLPSGIGNIVIADARLEYNGVIYPMTFNGSKTFTLLPGTYVVSDPVIGLEFAGTSTDIAWARTYATWSAGQKLYLGGLVESMANSLYPNYVSSDTGGINHAPGTTGSNQAGTAGVAWATSNFAYAFSPAGIIGKLNTPAPVWAIIRDSIAQGLNDLGRANIAAGLFYGAVLRGIAGDRDGSTFGNLGNGPTFVRLPLESEQVNTFLTPVNRLYRSQLLSMATHAISNYGTNDIYDSPTRTATQLKADLLSLWKILAHKGLTVYQTTLLPRTTSTDNWATATNQSPVSSTFEGYRQAINLWLRSPASAGAGNSALLDAGGALTGIVDGAALVEVNSSNVLTLTGGSWITNGTADFATEDGIHPQRDSAVLIAPSVRAISSTLTLAGSGVPRIAG